MTMVGIQRLINHHIRAAWEMRREARQRPAIRQWCQGQQVAHLNTIEYLRAL
jgi:hypothetical protein